MYNSNDMFHIMSMEHSDYSSSLDSIIKVSHISSSDMIFKVGLCHSDKTFNLNDITILDANIKVTGKDNIFIDLSTRYVSNSLKIFAYYDPTNTLILKLDIYSHKTNHSSVPEKCLCFDCLNFIKTQLTQKCAYESAYLHELLLLHKSLNNTEYEDTILSDDVDSISDDIDTVLKFNKSNKSNDIVKVVRKSEKIRSVEPIKKRKIE